MVYRWSSEYDILTITIIIEIAPTYETIASTDSIEGQPVQSIHSPSSTYVNKNWSQYFVGFDLPSKKRWNPQNPEFASQCLKVHLSIYHALLACKPTKQKEQAKPHGYRKPLPMLRTLKLSCFSTMLPLGFFSSLYKALTFMSVYFTAVCYKRHLFRPAHVFVSN